MHADQYQRRCDGRWTTAALSASFWWLWVGCAWVPGRGDRARRQLRWSLGVCQKQAGWLTAVEANAQMAGTGDGTALTAAAGPYKTRRPVRIRVCFGSLLGTSFRVAIRTEPAARRPRRALRVPAEWGPPWATTVGSRPRVPGLSHLPCAG